MQLRMTLIDYRNNEGKKKRKVSAKHRVIALECDTNTESIVEPKKKEKPSMVAMVLSGDVSHKFVEMLSSPRTMASMLITSRYKKGKK